LRAEVRLPAVLSCAERLTEPSKVDPPGRAAVPDARIRRVTAADLGPGPWGQDASPTWVGPVKDMAVERVHKRWPDASIDEQVANVMRLLHERGALTSEREPPLVEPVATTTPGGPLVAVVIEPDRAHATRELLGAAAGLGGRVVALTIDRPDTAALSSWGADEIVHLTGSRVEEDFAHGIAEWADDAAPWAVLAGSTAFGREVASRAAARLGAGLTGDAVDLEVEDGQLIAWKPAFGGQLVAAIYATSSIQMATVRPGVLSTRAPRAPSTVPIHERDVEPRGRVRVIERTRDDDIDILAEARTVIGVGTGVSPDEYAALEPLRAALGAELGATRKVTDKGWLPRARQIGITGRAIAPCLYVSIGASGKFNHAVGVRAAQTVFAINPDLAAPIWSHADIGIVADWHDAVPRLVAALRDT
jgi:electron transfer flavoprotein alpha subunit